MNAIEEQINRRKTARQKRSPPPMVIFGAQMEITQQNRRFRTSYYQNNENQEQKSEHVVSLMSPNAVQDEEKLDKYATERQNAAHHHTGHGFRVQSLLGNLSRNLVSTNRMFDRLLFKSEKGSNERQRNRNAEPQSQNGD
jgi:hypothetical protein